MARASSRRRAAAAEGELTIPPFLRLRPGDRKITSFMPQPTDEPPEEERLERVQITEYVRLAETKAEEAGFHLHQGVIPRRWHGDADGEKLVLLVHERMAEKAAKLDAKAPPNPLKGTVRLSRILPSLPGKKLKIGMAKKAVDAAGLEHAKYRFAPELVPKVKETLLAYEPPAKARKPKRGDDLDRGAVIRFHGKNPKKPGTSAHDRWKVLIDHDKRTVAEFLKAKGNQTTLANAIAAGYVKLGGAAQPQGKPEPKGKGKVKRRK